MSATAAAPESPVDALAQRLLDSMLTADPLEATLYGFREYDARLADLSTQAESALAIERASIRSAALRLDPASLSDRDAVTRSVIIAQTEYADAWAAAASVEYTVAAFPVSPSSILLAYLRMIVVTNGEEAEAYLARLRAIPEYLSQARERLAAGRDAGLLPVARLVQMAVDQIDLYFVADPSPLLLDAPGDWPGRTEWQERCAEAIRGVVDPAIRAYREHLVETVLPLSRGEDAVGLVHLPGGAERYRALVRLHTTTDRTPDDLHNTGLAIVAAIHAEFRELGRALFGLDDVKEIFAHLQDDPSLRWASAAEILAAAEVAVRRAEAVAPEWFGRCPQAVCALEQVPELEAEGSASAYYMPPTLDGSRPGTYYQNVNRPTERTSFDLESIAFHEAVPGHHFQIALALELDDLPMLRRLPLFNAYAEGWGLYSERLADEMGLYSSPLQRMGMLSADVWRATRLVVDTGMHARGWSRQQAVDYFLANTPVAPLEVDAEVDRYIALPAQALGYMTGRLHIEDLRSRAESALGSAFDIREFHDVVLGSGGLPLAVLTQVVEDWIAARQ